MDKIVKGIVLKASEYKDADKMLTLLTLEEGKISVKARGVKKSTSKLKPYCQSFCFADFELAESHGMYILTGVNHIDSFFDLTTDYEKFSYGYAVLEILDKVCVESQTYVPLFIDSLKCLKALSYSTLDPRLVLSKFIINLLSYEGFNLNLNKCSHCKLDFAGGIYLDYMAGELLCPACKTFDSFEIDKSVFATMKILSNNDYDNLNTIKISKNILDKTLDALTKDLCLKFEFKLNSLKL